MRKIKFRWKDKNKKTVFREFHQEGAKQFVGYDSNDKEVYEGDLIITATGFITRAALFDNLDEGRITLKSVTPHT